MDAIDIIDYRRKKHVCSAASGMSTKHNGRLLSASENTRTGFEHRILNKLVSPWPLFIKYYVLFPPDVLFAFDQKCSRFRDLCTPRVLLYGLGLLTLLRLMCDLWCICVCVCVCV